MCTHLFRREGGTYYFRRAIPLGKRSQFGGRREWIVSLRTKDRAEAKRLMPGYVQAFDRAMLGDATGESAEKPLCGISEPIPVIAAVSVREASKGPVWAPVPLLDTFDAYVREQGIKAVTANEWRGNLRALVRHVGHDDAARLTVENIDSWRDLLLAERTKRGGLRSPRTVKDKYISALRSTLNYAISKRKLTQNVAAMVDVRVPRKMKLRERDFTSEEAKAILSETIKEQEGVSVFIQRARRWIPWLCAYTGARVNEISQLRGSDV